MPRLMTLLFACLLAVSAPAHAGAPHALNGTYLYHFAWNNFSLGSLLLEIQEGNGRYRIRSDVQAAGLVKLFNKHISHTKVEGKMQNGVYQPLSYESLYQTKEKKKRVALQFDETGAVKSELSLPRGGGTDRSALTDAQKTGAKDPLTALVTGRALAAMGEVSPQSFPLYDGTRLAQAKLSPGMRESLTIGKETVRVAHWIASRTPVGGYTPKELKKMKKGEPPLHLYFAKDGSALPLRIEVALPLGTVTGFLVGECGSRTKCEPLADWNAMAQEWEAALGK